MSEVDEFLRLYREADNAIRAFIREVGARSSEIKDLRRMMATAVYLALDKRYDDAIKYLRTVIESLEAIKREHESKLA